MKDYFLRAENRQAMDHALINAGLLSVIEGEPITSPEVAILDYIGQIPEETGHSLTDEDGFEYPEMTPIDGYHANLRVRGELTPEQLAILPVIPKPNKPHRVFAS